MQQIVLADGESIPTVKRILILRLSSIGDVVLVSPLVRVLRRRLPQAEIDFVVKAEFAELMRHNPHLNAVHEVPTAARLAGLQRLREKLADRRYDTVLDLHKNFRTQYLLHGLGAGQVLRYRKHVVRRWLHVRFKLATMRNLPPVYQRYLQAAAPLGVRDDGAGTELHWLPSHEAEAAQALPLTAHDRTLPMLALAPGAGYFTKRWPPEYFAELAGLLLARGRDCWIAVLGGEQDRAAGQQIAAAGHRVIDLTGRLSLLAAAAVLARSRLVVANDSGLMHMAEAVKTPVLMLAGSTTRALGFFPQRRESLVLENQALPCRPCSHLGHAACPRRHFRCMRDITPAQVVAALERWRPDLLR
ncbi:MAG: lipopolysaccharide heptosyltransferase II [candidate division KSB1 bacterium]|nr:lipopolysaccharide heptosyltransferase II [candidate division KSB1 bacterium]MDZ7273264.1 lipopolysaccharide heptosyltransferase II [candidate division KSB1 bacterium]MDZ7285366.1 lipopolysaccharide heptosyltransferase II [candidate division KSB1 bacterium]MDZ7298398.1 lipopolysaccharide heptosyltransferase II [candidate division KSB1 bacterium]MDZ7306476.1 lipopolysaccharide heptosyltransferase II [candidate division KSB1 bacterium]